MKDIETMNSFGSRTTGSVGHNQFISWLEQQLTDRGLEVHHDRYTFDRWEEKRSAVSINNEEVPAVILIGLYKDKPLVSELFTKKKYLHLGMASSLLKKVLAYW